MLFSCVGSSDGMEALTAEDIPEEEGSAQAPVAPPESKPLPAPAPESPVAKFVGTYKWVGGVAEQRTLWGKIENMANTFNFIAKPIVRDKLAAGNQIPKTIRIESDGKDKTEQRAPVDGTSTKIKATNGEMMDMSFDINDELVQTFKGNAKGRVNSYRLDGDKLTFHVRIHASQLPKELEYELTYERE
ncbi:MAG: hypothetical protein HOV80_19485 [Polyangiaceae bacterium]|nr:hypothetical protein [Polyangiaceae bacterium]